MALIPWKPSDLDRFFENDDWFFPVRRLGELGGPAMDLYETDKEVIAELNAPGMNADNFDVTVKDGLLSVRGSAEEEKEDKGKGYWKKEIHRGSFERAVRLLSPVKESGVSATYTKGILRVTMQKAEEKAPPQIKVKSGDEK